MWRLTLLLLQLQIHDCKLARVKHAERLGSAAHVVVIGLQLVVVIYFKPRKVIAAVSLSDEGSNLQRPDVFQLHHGSGNRFVLRIDYGALNGTRTGVFFVLFLVLCKQAKKKNKEDAGAR